MSMEPPPATEWTRQDQERADLVLAELDAMLVRADGQMSMTGAQKLGLLAFEPTLDLQFSVQEVVDGVTRTKPVSDPDDPTSMKIQQCLGRRTPHLKW